MMHILVKILQNLHIKCIKYPKNIKKKCRHRSRSFCPDNTLLGYWFRLTCTHRQTHPTLIITTRLCLCGSNDRAQNFQMKQTKGRTVSMVPPGQCVDLSKRRSHSSFSHLRGKIVKLFFSLCECVQCLRLQASSVANSII